MSRIDDELERIEQVNELKIAARLGAGRAAGAGTHDCIDCDTPIPQARRQAAPGCNRCIDCQTIHDLKQHQRTGGHRHA